MRGMQTALVLITGAGANARYLMFQGAPPRLHGFVEGLAPGAKSEVVTSSPSGAQACKKAGAGARSHAPESRFKNTLYVCRLCFASGIANPA